MKIYFSGIGGVGIGPLAEIAKDAGHEICGSDAKPSLMTDQLTKDGASVSFNQSGVFLTEQHNKKPIDWFVYTAALPKDHPELMLAHKLSIKTAKRDELLAYIIKEKKLKLIAIAGTHGKTTTTGMMVWLFKKLGIPISYSIGTTLSWGPSGYYDPASKYFIYECDEFDRNFLHFEPHLSIITSIGYDHPDTYPTEADYKKAFRQFIGQSKTAIIWKDDADFINDHSVNIKPGQIHSLGLAGEHNRRNASLVLDGMKSLKIGGLKDNTEHLNNFPGTARRFEKLGNNLYSDYGHHPAEIAATLQMAREVANDIVLVYQPHQNVRQHEIIEQYSPEVFKNASMIYWLPTYLSREDESLKILKPKQLVAKLSPEKVEIAELDDSLWDTLKHHSASGRLVLFMGAGSIDEWARKKSSA